MIHHRVYRYTTFRKGVSVHPSKGVSLHPIFYCVALDNTTPSLVLHSMSSATPGIFTQVRVAGCPTVNGIGGDTLTPTPTNNDKLINWLIKFKIA